MIVTRILIVSIILFLNYCNSEKKSNYKEIFTLKVILDNSRKPQPVTTCQASYSAMQLCVATSPEFSTITLTEPILSSTISSSRYLSYLEICNNLIVSDIYKDFSDSTKDCFFKCDTSYWQTRKNLNICNSTFITMNQGIGTDSGTISCRKSCATPTNNNP